MVDEAVDVPCVDAKIVGKPGAGGDPRLDVGEARTNPRDQVLHRPAAGAEEVHAVRAGRAAGSRALAGLRLDEAGEQPQVGLDELVQQPRPVDVHGRADEVRGRRADAVQRTEPHEPAMQRARDELPQPGLLLPVRRLHDHLDRLRVIPLAELLARHRRPPLDLPHLLGDDAERHLEVQLHVAGLVVGVGPREQPLDLRHRVKIHDVPLLALRRRPFPAPVPFLWFSQ